MIKKVFLYKISLEKPNIRFWLILIFAIGILTGFQTAKNHHKCNFIFPTWYSCFFF